MTPVGFRKRNRSPSPGPPSNTPRASKRATKKVKPTLFDAIDSPQRPTRPVEETRRLLEQYNDDEDESDSDVDSEEFGDVPPAKKRKTDSESRQDSDDASEEEMVWEDAIDVGPSNVSGSKIEPEIGDISVSMNDDGTYEEPLVNLATGKKGPSKRERHIRFLTHQLHVQCLMWHNTIRNSWLNDKQVQKILVGGLADGVKREITRWKEAMGTLSQEELEAKKKEVASRNKRKGRKGKDTSKARDWGYEAKHSEQGVPNLSGGDPLFRLLKVLTSYWRKRFTVTAPAFRKRGYMPLKRLREEMKDWEKNRNDADDHGERIEDLQQFRNLARDCEGSRDVGAQLFVALLRGIGLETRMVSNLQPAGIGWSKAEEADPKKSKKECRAENEALKPEADEIAKSLPSGKSSKDAKKSKPSVNGAKPAKPVRKSTRGDKGDPIGLDDSGSSLSEPPSDVDFDAAPEDEDDLSVVDITPATPKKPIRRYDRDLAFPIYWTEVCSPATNKFIPVDPIVLSTIASSDELLQTFEPRGKGADKAKQVICYVIAYSSDGSAKDVTIRYLKRHQLPGKTKGTRMPPEKVPVYNKRGKVKRYEDYDWFRTVMSVYDRPRKKRTAADDAEDQTDLKPFKPAKEEKEVEKESLQWYKQSAEFVLEQHLRREEAILPDAEPVKTFTARGKGKETTEHPVFRREDVVVCKTVETWHKEGRAVKIGEQPMKQVPVRGVTLTRKREMEEHFQEHGEKLQQGLYSWDQTDWIIPPPIEDGVIPKNAFGNMDVYVETMVPKGAVHLPLKGTAKICRKLQIDYAEACTGFEFGKQRAVPVLTGVVVAKENAQMVKDAWKVEQAELKRKEDTKRTAAALHWWRKMLMGMRIVERMKADYAHDGGIPDEINPFTKKALRQGRQVAASHDEAGAGGFFQPGHEEEEVPQHQVNGVTKHEQHDRGGGFLAEVDDDDKDEEMVYDDREDGGGFLVEEDPEANVPSEQARGQHAPITPISLQSMHNPEDQGDNSNEAQEDAMIVDSAPMPDPVERASSKGKKTMKTSDNVAAKPKPATKTNKKRGSRQKAMISTPPSDGDDGGVSALSAYEETDEELDEVIKSDSAVKQTSPQVVVTPQAKKPVRTRRTSSRAAKKATPVRSQYFNAAHEDDENIDDESSEQEVVRPTRTTARTRAKR